MGKQKEPDVNYGHFLVPQSIRGFPWNLLNVQHLAGTNVIGQVVGEAGRASVSLLQALSTSAG